MAAVELYTYLDAVDHLIDYVGSTSGDSARRFCRRAVQEALRELSNAHDWMFYHIIADVSTVGD